MKIQLNFWRTILAAVTILGASACKTTDESASNSLSLALDADFGPEVWNKSCQAELANAETGAAARAQLMQLAQTDDCKVAYPAVRKMVEQYIQGAQKEIANKS